MHFKALMTIVQSLDSDTDGIKQRRSPNRSLARLQTYQVKYFVLRRSSDIALLTKQIFKHTALAHSRMKATKHDQYCTVCSPSFYFVSFRVELLQRTLVLQMLKPNCLIHMRCASQSLLFNFNRRHSLRSVQFVQYCLRQKWGF